MVQVRDNRKVCRLAVPPGVFALLTRSFGKSQQFSNRVQTSGCTPRRVAVIRARAAKRRLDIPSGLTLNNAKSRLLTVNYASFCPNFLPVRIRSGCPPGCSKSEDTRRTRHLVPNHLIPSFRGMADGPAQNCAQLRWIAPNCGDFFDNRCPSRDRPMQRTTATHLLL
jgi:hypothetical protein